eukprot:jgi/Chrzof1/10446/UNPLg00373.t1
MAPLSPNVLAAVMAELERVKVSYPSIGNLIRLRGLSRLPGLNDGLIYPLDSFPEGTSLNVARAAALNKAPLRGAINALVVLVEFPDKRFAEASTKEHFENLFFSDGTPQLSANEYYKRVSNGAIRLTGAVAGPYRMPFNLSYYANNDSGMSPQEPNARTLAQHAVEAVNADFSVGSLAGYDNNGDGYMDAFVIVHAGPGAETLPGPDRYQNIWSLKWVLPNHGYQPRDGPAVYPFLTVPEDSQVGVCAHEIGHLIFGWPDLYDTDYSSAGLGNWCLMAGGSWNNTNGVQGTLPCDPSAWCKVQQGWVNVLVVSSPEQALQIMDVKKGNRNVFRVDIKGDGTEYLLIENRQRTGLDEGMPGAGLLIYHVDETVADNKDDWHPKVMLLQADGRFDLNYNRNGGDDSDPFPGKSRVTEISDDTTPNTSSFNRTRSGIRISLISNPGETMTCQVSKARRVPRFDAPLVERAASSLAAARGLEPTVLPPGLAAGVPLAAPTAVPAAVASGPAKDRTDELLSLLIAQEKLNTTVLTDLLQLVRLLAAGSTGSLSLVKAPENGDGAKAT